MPDTSIDIIDLLHDIDPDRVTYIVQRDRRRYHAAITALVAERDGYLDGNKQVLRALAEANEIAARYKRERDEAHTLIRRWKINLVEIVDDGEIMYAMTYDGRCNMTDANKRAFLAATRKEGGGA